MDTRSSLHTTGVNEPSRNRLGKACGRKCHEWYVACTSAVMVKAQEERCPLWAAIVPALYLPACAAAARTILQDPTAEIGVSGLLAAVGMLPAFAVPVVFASCRATLSAGNEGLLVDGRL